MKNLGFLPSPRILFVLLSVADLGLTWWLLTRAGDSVYESNPLAAWWLANAGWLGLAAFKVGLVLLVLGLVALLGRLRPRAGSSVLGFGCAILALVVCYSSVLAFQVDARESAALLESERAMEEANITSREATRQQLAFSLFREQLGEEVLAGHYTLEQACNRLATSERLKDTAWLHALPGFQNCSTKECLARQLLAVIRVVSRESKNPEAARQAFQRATAEFETLFGHQPPEEIRAVRLG
jgi:hypothetical protein